MAQVRERLVQSVLTLGMTLAIFLYADAPPVVFAVMPMFAWLAFRGTLREASLLLAGVGAIATGMTVLGLGPVHELLVATTSTRSWSTASSSSSCSTVP